MAVRTWSGLGIDDLWTRINNWVGGVVPVNGDSVIFAGTTRLNPDNNISSLSLVDITFANGAGAFDLDGNQITLTGDIISNDNTDMDIGMDIILSAGVHIIDTTSTGRIDLEGVISGAGSITKNGGEQLRFENNNSSWSGGLTWNAGDLRGHNSNSFGTGDITIGSTERMRLQGNMNVPNDLIVNATCEVQSLGGAGNTLSGDVLLNTDLATYNHASSTPLTLSGVMSGTGGVINNNPDTLIINGNNTYTGDTEINLGSVFTGHANALGNNSNVILTFGAILDVSFGNIKIGSLEGDGNISLGAVELNVSNTDASPADYAGIISGTGSVKKTGTGKLILTGLNTYTGETTVVQGILEFNSIGDVGGGASALGNPSSVANGTIELQRFDPILRYTGTGDTTDRVLHFVSTPANHYIDMSGTGTLEFQSDFTADDNARTIIFTGSTAGVGYLNMAAIPDGATTVTTVVKEGSGKWIFNGSDTYTGTTTVSAGTLMLEGNPVGATGNTSVSSGATLGGGGNIYNDVTFADGSILDPSDQTGGETLQAEGAIFAGSNCVINYILGVGAGVSDRFDIDGALTLDGTINVAAGTGFVAGTYTIINYSGVLTNNGLIVGTIPEGFKAVVNTSTGGQIDLIISSDKAVNLVGNLDGGLIGGFQ